VARRIPIRVKLACALAVPLLGLMGGAALQVQEAEATADAAAAETDLAAAAVGPGSLVSQLQNERNLASVDLIGMADAVRLPVDDVDDAREATDAALEELRGFVADRGPDAQSAFAEGLAAVESGLAAVRERVDGFSGARTLDNDEMADEVFDAYAEIINALLDGTAGIALRIDDAELRTGVELVDLSTRLYEARSSVIRDATAFVLAGQTTQSARLQVAAKLAEIEALEQSIEQRAVAPYAGFVEAGLRDVTTSVQDSLLQGFTASGELDVPALLDSIESGPQRGVLLVRRQASLRLLAEADRILVAADEERRTVIVFGGALVVASLALTILVSRSVTRPLAELTAQAEAMAGERLPAAVKAVLDTPLGEDVAMPDVEPIHVKTRDEVRDVAAALNVVQRSALDLALEQTVLRRNIADSFVNMGRRNQNLLDRQLDFITELEREEVDPDRLASLFRLDHLATRMRRNAESLLRLAGSEPQRRWSAPVEMSDVIRGALGEVEDYQRVQVKGVDAAAVAGGFGSDLAHALAELLENALTFSPPTETVEIRGRRTAEGYVIAMSDNGLGMTPDELAVANRRLAGAESFTVAPSRYLGHYVAGHLAKRLGIAIELQPGPAGGLVARIDIPASVLVEMPAMSSATIPAPAPAPAVVDGVTPDDDIPPLTYAEATAPAPPTPAALFEPVPAAPATTPSGLVRRVPGAQHPTTDIGDRRTEATHPAEEPERPDADAVSSFLSDFSAGVARGIADAGRNPWEESDERR
jgi:signal transduction histidine kinase